MGKKTSPAKANQSTALYPENSANELARAVEALQVSEEKYRTVIENIEDGYYEVDLKGNFTFFNSAMARITGFSANELLGMNNRDMMDRFNTKQVYQVFNQVFQTGLATKAFDWQLIRKDGSRCILEVSISLKKQATGEPVGFMGIARDVTRRKMMEQALRDNEEKYRMIIENIEDGYYEVDLAGNFIFFNDALARITGYDRKDLLGMNNRDIMDAFNAKRVFSLFNAVYGTGLATKAFDWELIRKDDCKRYVEVSVSLKRDLKGHPIGFMGIARDITERRETEELLRRSEEKLRGKTRNLEEVNTALTVLLKKREEDKIELEQTVLTNLNDMVKPYLERVKERARDPKQKDNLVVLEENLNAITSPFSYRLSSRYLNLTSSEIEIANLVKQGQSTKDIADLLNVSSKTIEVHRLNIRKKLGLSNKKASLRTHLLSVR
ncbi:MAG: PAS domain S-box protein [Deltaproteobacteria bacterium]|nr:PAS domain S-box protein [Deltaproteobacteria bacterium]